MLNPEFGGSTITKCAFWKIYNGVSYTNFVENVKFMTYWPPAEQLSMDPSYVAII